MDLSEIRTHKAAITEQIATLLLDFTNMTGVPVELEAKPVTNTTIERGRLVEAVERYEVSMVGRV